MLPRRYGLTKDIREIFNLGSIRDLFFDISSSECSDQNCHADHNDNTTMVKGIVKAK